MNKFINVGFGAVLLAILAGCGAEKPNSFVGHWVEVPGSTPKPMTLDISYSDAIFHIDEKKNVLGKDFERKLEGRADSATTLSALGGALTMRLENGHLFYNGRELVKSP
ncbi:hypothetical protein [Pseudomonas sp. PSPC3-3]|uniref:hypothetical protein n=1 Tax=unclassified Pseudomonas TaxID=196821 RepID=UPI003CF1460A